MPIPAKHSSPFKTRKTSTIKAYEGDWQQVLEWCKEHSFDEPLSVESFGAFLSNKFIEKQYKYKGKILPIRQPRRISTLRRFTASINQTHDAMGLPSPGRDQKILDLLKAFDAARGGERRRISEFTLEDLRSIQKSIRREVHAELRDWALIATGYWTEKKAAKLVRLVVPDIPSIEKDSPQGPLCPIRAIRDWLASENIRSGPIFRPGHGTSGTFLSRCLDASNVTDITQKYAARIGKNPHDYGARSLRMQHDH